jgi:hypothetical protein
MAFTSITITSTELCPDGSPAAGTVTATLTQQMVNGSDVAEPTPVAGVYDDAGQLQSDTGVEPFVLLANDDPGTTPGAMYRFTIEIDSAPVRTGIASVPHDAAGATIDLSVLLEGQ